jgi:hypothetical protein
MHKHAKRGHEEGLKKFPAIRGWVGTALAQGSCRAADQCCKCYKANAGVYLRKSVFCKEITYRRYLK